LRGAPGTSPSPAVAGAGGRRTAPRPARPGDARPVARSQLRARQPERESSEVRRELIRRLGLVLPSGASPRPAVSFGRPGEPLPVDAAQVVGPAQPVDDDVSRHLALAPASRPTRSLSA